MSVSSFCDSYKSTLVRCYCALIVVRMRLLSSDNFGSSFGIIMSYCCW